MNFAAVAPLISFLFASSSPELAVREVEGSGRGSVTFSNQRTGQILQEEQATGLSGHKCRRNPRGRLVSQGHPERQALPLHSTAEGAVSAADDLIAAEEQAWADRIGERRDMRRAALETGQGILFDRQRMQLGTQPMSLLLPFGHR